jgi:NitT/TauT family transport system permease protein
MGGFLVAAPTAVLRKLSALLATADFWLRVCFSLARIAAGFFAALLLGSLLAVAAGRFAFLEFLFWPYVAVIKATPVASFIILCLIWMGSANLSAAISFLMVLPIIYSNMLQGIRSTDGQLVEMADIFRVGWGRRMVYIYFPQLKPYMISACSVALGMTWKSGVAAEVIGIPRGSIGEALYEAKVYLNAQDLFAWTAVIILVSVAFEKVFMACLRKAYDKLENIGHFAGEAPAMAEAALPPAAPRPASGAMDIRVQGLSKSYGDKQVLSNFSAVFLGGRCTCIMGDSGVGKTTLLRILMGLAAADSGAVDGIEGLKPGAVFQEDRLCDSFNAVSNVSLACGKRIAPERIASHLAALGLGDSLNQPVRELSGGMRRRVAIARAILAGSQILFMDEPLKGLDERNREIVAGYIREHTRGITTLMVTHSHEEVELMDGVLLTMDQPMSQLAKLSHISHSAG